jgi:hypothetical protein
VGWVEGTQLSRASAGVVTGPTAGGLPVRWNASALAPGGGRVPGVPSKTAPPARPKRIGRPPEGRVKILISVEPAQLTALRREAFARATAEDRGRPDVSALIRDAIDAWIARRK